MDPVEDQVNDSNIEEEILGTPTEVDESPPVQEAPPEPPEWAQVLEVLPESLRSTVEPEIQKYAEAQRSKYTELEEKLSPWNTLLEQYELDSVDPVDKALQFAMGFEQNPVETYKQITTWLKNQGMLEEEEETVPAQPAPQEEEENDLEFDDPQLSQFAKTIQEQLKGITEVVGKLSEETQASKRAEEEANNQKALDDFLGELEKKFDVFDKDYVIAQMTRGVKAEQAAKSYQERVLGKARELAQPAQEAPVVMGGGSLPSNQITSPGKLSKKDRIALAAQMAREDAANRS